MNSARAFFYVGITLAIMVKSATCDVTEPAIQLQVALKGVADSVSELRLDIIYKVGTLEAHRRRLSNMKAQLNSTILLLGSVRLDDDVIKQLENDLRSVQEKSTKINDLREAENRNEIIIKLEEIEQDLLKLVYKIDDLVHVEDDKPIEEINNDKIKQIQKQLEKDREEERIKRLPYECIEAIRSRDFDTAGEKLKLITDERKINFVVGQVYNHQPINFKLIRAFAEHLQDIEKKVLILKALKYELAINEDDDPLKLFQLIESVKDLNNEGANLFKKETQDALLPLIKSIFKNGLITNTFNENKCKETSNAIFIYNRNLYKQVLNETFDEVFRDVPTTNILESMKNQVYYYQQMLALYLVYLRMVQHDQVNSNAMLKLGFMVKQLIDDPIYPTHDEEIDAGMEKMKDACPLWVKNAAFASKVCLKNVEYGEYLYAASDDWNYDTDRRTCFTWVPKNQVSNGEWKIERDNDDYYLKNVFFDEYLFSGATKHFLDHLRRRVFTWRPKGRVSQGRFQIGPEGDNCYFKSSTHEEYLRADSNLHDNSRRHVSTVSAARKDNSALWTIEEC